MPTIARHVPRPPQPMIEAFARLEAATVYEAAGPAGAMDHTVRPIAWGQRACGVALTVRCHPGDNLMLHAAIAIAQPGDVIVADVGGLQDAGYWGEITTVAAQARGVVALVIGGGIRDRAAIVARGFAIWSAGICVRATVKRTVGDLNVPVVVGGVTISPGDLVLADDDGVVAVARDALEVVLERARAREAKEAAAIKCLQEGALTLDLLGFRGALEDQGVAL